MSVRHDGAGSSPHLGPSATASRPLPDRLVSGPFDLPAAWAAGLTRHAVEGPLWQRTTRGIYLWSTRNADDTMIRIQTAAELLPEGAAIGGWASLFLQGAADLDGGPDMRVQRTARLRPSRARGAGTPSPPTTTLAPVTICVGPRALIRPRPGIDVSRRRMSPDDIVMVGDIPVLGAARSLVDLVAKQPSEEGLVSIDAALRGKATQADAIAAYLQENPRVQDARRIRRLLGLADGASRSCPESRLRWIWVVEAGLPRPLVNPEVADQQGQLLGLPDLLDPESALVGESDGSQHRELHAHTADNAREERFERHNMLVVRATIVDIFPRRRQLVGRLQAGYRDGCARDRSRDRWALRRPR
jgi:hypothetical protein